MLKGCIELSKIKCVEIVCSDVPIPCSFKYPFQVTISLLKHKHTTLPMIYCKYCAYFLISVQMSLQVFHGNYYLYIFAPDNDCRQRWVRALKEGNVFLNIIVIKTFEYIHVQNTFKKISSVETKCNNLVAKYHPNFWMDGKWRCCQQTEKLATGCHVYDPEGYGLYYSFLLLVECR